MATNTQPYPSQDRILGRSAVIDIISTNGPVQWAVCDSFDVASNTKEEEYQPLGAMAPRPQLIYGSYKLTFKGAKVDETIDQLFYGIDQALLNGQASPRFRITETITLLDGSEQTWVYPDTVLGNFKKSMSKATDPITYDFDGTAPIRIPG